MSAPAPNAPSSLSSSGFEDGLGRRVLAFDRETGEMLERLVLRPELVAFEKVLLARVETIAALDDERFARPRDLEEDEEGRLTVVSEFVAGRRLSEVLDTARDAGIVPGLDAALGLLLEILPALGNLHGMARFAHGSVSPARIVFTPAGQIVLLDPIYGSALERLAFTRQRLWNEFGIAMPPSAGPARFDIAADLTQAAMTAAALIVGRPLGAADYPNGIQSLRAEILEVAQIRGTTVFANGIEKFFDRVLPLTGRKAFPSADDAVLDLRQLVRREIGIDACRTALLDFLQQVESAEAERAAAEEALAGERREQARIDAERREREKKEAAGRERERAEAEARERARLAAERREKEKQEAARRERERLDAERRERERLEAERKERERLEAERREKERLEAERRERERLEAERRERERLEAERKERERLEAERRERERLEAERRKKERLERERIERERLEAEQRERERLEAERLEKERLERERLERERLEAELRERARLEAERLEKERRERERLERERLEAEQRERARLEAERLERERQARLEAERKERERLEAERRERERLEAERKERERLETERREKERLEAERRERERLAKLEAERKERERLEAERRARERLEAERREKERLEAERRERERLAKLEAERKEKERLEAERRERERLEAERREKERLDAERRERERQARLEAERKEKERLEAERREKERLERERVEAERREKERAAAERREQERREQERREQERREQELAAQAAAEERESFAQSSKRRKREKSARSKKDRLRSTAAPSSGPTAPAHAPATAGSKSSWLVPPDRAAAFEPPVPVTAPPPVQVVAPQAYPVYTPPATQPPIAAAPPPVAVPPVVAPPVVPPPVTTPTQIGFAPPKPIAQPQSAPIGLAQRPPIRLKHEPVSSPPASFTPRRDRDVAFAQDFSANPTDKTGGGIPWKMAAAAGAVLLVGMVAVNSLWPTGKGQPKEPKTANPSASAPVSTPAPSSTAGQIILATQPPGAKVLLDGKAVGESPVTLPTVTPGRHTLTLITESGSVKKSVRVEAGKTVSLDIPIFSGFAAISAPIVVEVSEGGRLLGTSENQVMLSPGRHQLKFTNNALNYHGSQTVEIEPGEVYKVSLEPRGSANINAQPWAEVWIDGVRVGETPIANVSIALGVREIVFRNPQFGERKLVTTITGGPPAALSVDFNKQ